MTATAPDGGPARRRPLDGELDLAGQLADLADKHNQLATEAAVLGAHLSDEQQHLRAQVASLGGSVNDLAQQIEKMFGDAAADPATIDWWTLSREDAEKAWSGLWQWLENFYLPRYAPTREELPDCWPLHAGMRDELSWLWCAHRAAYAPQAAVGTAAQWHTLWRASAFAQIKDLAHRFDCGPGRHCGTPHGDLPPENQPTEPRFWRSEGIQVDLDARPGPTEQAE